MLSVQSKHVLELAKTTMHSQMDLNDGEVRLELGEITKKEWETMNSDYYKLEEKLGKAWLKLSGPNQLLVFEQLRELNFESILDGF